MAKRSKRILVVAVDGGAARFFEGARLAGPFVELETRRLTAAAPASAPKPTRVHDRLGPARHAVEARLSPRAAAEKKFLGQVAKAIDEGLDRFDHWVLCAPPRALGVVRRQLSEDARSRLHAEVAKDYVKEKTERLGALLTECVP